MRKKKVEDAYHAKLFKQPQIHKDNPNYVVFDIESLYKPYHEDEDNAKYIRQH